jgi:hypothetical protein
MQTVAFDASEFHRWKGSKDDRQTIFFTPLGIGVAIKEGKEKKFKTIYHKTRKNLIEDFQIPTKRLVYSNSALWKEIDHIKAIPICDKMVKKLQKTIEYVFCSYVILPPKDIETVTVGGYGSPLEEMPTMNFLRALTPMFSYITAWAHSGKHRLDDYNYLIDNFSSKHTTAWRDLTSHLAPKIFPRGDECNEFISIADMIGYLTEKKLWDKKLWLRPENVEMVWDTYDFYTETRFIDENVRSKIRWYSKTEIPKTEYLIRPLIHLDIEGISISKLSTDPIVSAAAYACSKGGAFQGFDPHLDAKKIKDGDVYVYAGKQAKLRADSFNDMFEIEILSVKELRKKAKELL